eukprot:3607546-Pyramimonas_sp.AAC.1
MVEEMTARMLDMQTAQPQQQGDLPEEVRPPMETGYFDQLIPMTAPQQGNLPNTPQMSPQSGGGAEMALDPDQL